MRFTFSIIILFFLSYAKAQNSKIDTVFFNGSDEVVDGNSNYMTFELRPLDNKERVEGTAWRYTRSGRVIESTDYLKGLKNGKYERYNPLGNVMISGYYNSGKMIGRWTTMNVKGQIIRVVDYGMRGEIEEVYDSFNWTANYIGSEAIVSKEEQALGVNRAPSFPGGMNNWGKFLRQNLTYPNEAKDGDYQGTVYILFSVLQNGLVVNPIVVQSPHQSLSKEAIRIMNKSPKWLPAMKNEKAVDSQMKIRIVFRMR